MDAGYRLVDAYTEVNWESGVMVCQYRLRYIWNPELIRRFDALAYEFAVFRVRTVDGEKFILFRHQSRSI